MKDKKLEPIIKFKELKLIKIIKRNLKIGLVPAALMILSILIVCLIVQTLNGITEPLYQLFDQYIPGSKIKPLNTIYLTVFSLIVTLLLLVGFGAIITAIKTKSRGITKFVAILILKLPFAKKFLMSEEVLETNGESPDQVQGLVIRFKTVFGLDALGFAMKQLKTFDCKEKQWRNEFMVIVPNSPMPWSGYIHFVPIEEARLVGVITVEKDKYLVKKMSKADCVKAIISAGLSIPSALTISDIGLSFDEVQKILSEHEEKHPRKKRQILNKKNNKECK